MLTRNRIYTFVTLGKSLVVAQKPESARTINGKLIILKNTNFRHSDVIETVLLNTYKLSSGWS